MKCKRNRWVEYEARVRQKDDMHTKFKLQNLTRKDQSEYLSVGRWKTLKYALRNTT
jgi:hypothetical protein